MGCCEKGQASQQGEGSIPFPGEAIEAGSGAVDS